MSWLCNKHIQAKFEGFSFILNFVIIIVIVTDIVVVVTLCSLSPILQIVHSVLSFFQIVCTLQPLPVHLALMKLLFRWTSPTGTWRNNNVIMTSKRRRISMCFSSYYCGLVSCAIFLNVFSLSSLSLSLSFSSSWSVYVSCLVIICNIIISEDTWLYHRYGLYLKCVDSIMTQDCKIFCSMNIRKK